ncbi:MAG: argininosuccinate lyase [Chromatiales bacterium]|jgi:argininosuccinate lyase|nr:argininosuccinate lyase [Chromatiales bacterium]
MKKPTDKLWSGRFTEATDTTVEEFGASVGFDQRLYRYDIQGSIAHARMLTRAGLLTEAEFASIEKGLLDIQGDIERGDFAWLVELEDVHMNIEARLTERIGEAGKKLHTGRSRNDQVATDLRLFMRSAIDDIAGGLRTLQETLLDIAERETDTIMPGFTHLQVAQPVTFGHHMMAWFEMLHRDSGRFADCRRRLNLMPLGAAALAGTSFPIDRAYTAELLGFDAPTENSLDAVSDRDFAIEFCAASATLLMHLSRFSEELILWSSAQFDFIELSDSYCTGSSIMPQKKNPDVPELVRGKSGRVYGHLFALLTLMKSQPLAYNKDNQEDKEPLFDTVDTVRTCLAVFAGMLRHMRPKPQRMLQAAKRGHATATDLADYLVRKGVAFRDAHAIVGKAVRSAIDENKDLAELPLERLREFSSVIDEDVFTVLSLEGSVSSRNHIGGTAPTQVRAAIARARKRLNPA